MKLPLEKAGMDEKWADWIEYNAELDVMIVYDEGWRKRMVLTRIDYWKKY